MCDYAMNLIVLISSFGFPHGNASSSRVRQVSRALLKHGWQVHVLVVRPTEMPGEEINTSDRGVYKGIKFTYTCGSRLRSNSFLVRRYRSLRGSLVALWRIIVEASHRKSVLYLYSDWPALCIPATALAKMLGVPVVVEVCEWRPAKQAKSTGTNPYYRHLRFQAADGVIVISSFLEKKVRRITGAANKPRIFRLPILTDLKEFEVLPDSGGSLGKYLLWCGQIEGYLDSIIWVIGTFGRVAVKYPEYKFVIAGKYGSAEKRIILGEAQHLGLRKEQVKLTGYVSREELLALFRGATALLAPLEKDIQSRARFPTKIGEYLASGRPVITNDVGDITCYLRDGENAFIAPPKNQKAFAKKIEEVIVDPELAARVGFAGRKVAKNTFHYEVHAEGIDVFLRTLLSI